MSQPSQILHQEDGIRYAVATPHAHASVVRLLSESFCREPMSAVLGASAGDLAPLVEQFMPDCLTNGLSVIATAADDPSNVAGVLINRDFKLPLPADVPTGFPWFLPIAQALMTVDEEYKVQRPNLQVGEAMDLWMAGVDGERFARKGIASRLIQLSADRAHARGFRRCVTECTGRYSQTAAQRAGFSERARLSYKDFRFDGQPVFAQVSQPHTHVILYEKEF